MGLLTDELLANIGKTEAPRTQVVTQRDIRKYSIATDQTQRKYLDGEVAPPLFHLAFFWDVVELDELKPDGVSVDTLLPKFPLEREMAGGLDITHHSRIKAGDVLTATVRPGETWEKEGRRSGKLIFTEKR